MWSLSTRRAFPHDTHNWAYPHIQYPFVDIFSNDKESHSMFASVARTFCNDHFHTETLVSVTRDVRVVIV